VVADSDRNKEVQLQCSCYEERSVRPRSGPPPYLEKNVQGG
jgi:hypothetical protein